ncbi:MAG TPA: adenylosuccinate lyase [Melioribacteraceae bacterium]|nr:adenylosuccinate lyase [Melioribacteraceae bacterium]
MIERYTLKEMGNIWSDEFKYSTWLKIEILACEARNKMGAISDEELKTIKEKANFNVNKILEIEETTKHDVIAFLTNVAEYVGYPSRHIHYGMTSSDVLDTALSYQMKTAGELILADLHNFKNVLKKKAVECKDYVCVGRTHGIHAEPTTFGLKLANWYEEVKRNIVRLNNAIDTIGYGKISGAVGTFEHLSPEVENYVCLQLGLKPAPISTQVLQRDRHAEFMTTLAIIGATLEKIAIEIRHLQRTEVYEAEEFFSKGQKGSSAMPHKRNPIVSERIVGLSRILRSNAMACLENVALWHERDISHSSVERILIPDSCIAINYMFSLIIKLIDNLLVYPENMLDNLNITRGLLFSQKLLLLLVEKGLTREEAYSVVQRNAMRVWQDKNKNLKSELIEDEKIKEVLSEKELDEIFSYSSMLKNVDTIFNRTIEKD